jgi:hypothetical protein
MDSSESEEEPESEDDSLSEELEVSSSDAMRARFLVSLVEGLVDIRSRFNI